MFRCRPLDVCSYLRNDWCSERDIGHEMPIHNIHMQPLEREMVSLHLLEHEEKYMGIGAVSRTKLRGHRERAP